MGKGNSSSGSGFILYNNTLTVFYISLTRDSVGLSRERRIEVADHISPSPFCSKYYNLCDSGS